MRPVGIHRCGAAAKVLDDIGTGEGGVCEEKKSEGKEQEGGGDGGGGYHRGRGSGVGGEGVWGGGTGDDGSIVIANDYLCDWVKKF